MKKLFLFLILLSFTLLSCEESTDDTAVKLNHLTEARKLVENILPENNEYSLTDTYVTWAGSDGAVIYSNKSSCSSFVTHLLMHSYGITAGTFVEYFGEDFPEAEDYYDRIADESVFMKIDNISLVEEGDFIAVKYLETDRTNTGHMMLVNSEPVQRDASSPLIGGTIQWEIEIIDVSTSGHGPDDTRLKSDGSWNSGAGRGVLRAYTDTEGAFAGYSWSTYSGSEFQNYSEHPFLAGRVKDEFIE